MSEVKFAVSREKDVVTISATPFSNVNFFRAFVATCANEIEAEAVLRAVNLGMWERVQRIRADAYERGYRDGRAKRARNQFHHGCINTEKQ